jgi:hypothetical protein
MGHTNFGTFEFANSIRPLSAHATGGAVCLAWHVQKLSASINVVLVGSQEVFKQPVDGITSPPYGLAAVLRITLPGITLSNSASRPYHLSIIPHIDIDAV